MGNNAEKSHPGWLRRHWKAVLAVWLGLAFSGGAVGIIAIHNAEATRLSIATAESNPVLSEQLGRPLKTGWYVSGSIDVQPGSGHAELTIPVSGPKGSGNIYSEARKQGGVWKLESLQFGKNGSSDILDLLAGPTSKSTATH
jgi:hypothetical protein